MQISLLLFLSIWINIFVVLTITTNASTVHPSKESYQPYVDALKEKLNNQKNLNFNSSRDLIEMNNCKFEEAVYLPGNDYLGHGYNFLRDESTFQSNTGGTILDDTWATTLKKTFKYRGTCYKIPDAFVSSSGSLGFQNILEISTQFEARASTSAYEFQHKESRERKTELNLGVSGYGASLDAAFSLSKTSKNQKDVKKESSIDSSQAKSKVILYGLKIMQTYPSKSCMNQWKKLFKNLNNYEEFRKYFENVGTHYFSSAKIGGEFSLSFSIKNSMELTSSSSSTDRASCVSLKASGTYHGITGSVGASHCSKSFVGDQRSKKWTEYTSNSVISCKGGNKCPSTGITDKNEGKKATNAWVESVPSHPAPLYGNKAWIFELMDKLIHSSEHNTRHQSLLKYFGGSDNLKENQNKLRQLRDAFKNHLINTYIGKDYYCNKVNPRDMYCMRKSAITNILRRGHYILSPVEWPSWYIYASDNDWAHGYDGKPGRKGQFFLEPVPGRTETFFMRPAHNSNRYMYMRNNIAAYVGLWGSNPGSAGHWKFSPSSQAGTFLIAPSKWGSKWNIYMQNNRAGWIKGYNGDPGNQGRWIIQATYKAAMSTVRNPGTFIRNQNGKIQGIPHYPNSDGKFTFIPINNKPDLVYISIVNQPRNFLYMKDENGHVAVKNGIPGEEGQWNIQYSRSSPGAFIISNAKRRMRYLVMRNNILKGQEGFPGTDGHWHMQWE